MAGPCAGVHCRFKHQIVLLLDVRGGWLAAMSHPGDRYHLETQVSLTLSPGALVAQLGG